MKLSALLLLARLSLCTLSVCTLSACANQSSPGQKAEAEALNARVEGLERRERENAEERNKLTEDLRALRQDMAALRSALEGVSRSLGPLAGGQPQQQADPHAATQPKSPRQALKDSLKNLMDVSKEAMERLSQDLDRSLTRPAQPEKAPAPPAGKGSQI